MKDTKKTKEWETGPELAGFHRIALDEPVRLCYASEDLCEMLGLAAEELVSETRDLYLERIHPSDKGEYKRFLRVLKERGRASADYRLLGADDTYFWVRDTASVEKDADFPRAVSVLTEITELKRENSDLRFLNDTVPCGFMKYTCEKQPRVTYMNKRMREFLRIEAPAPGEADSFEMLKENIFLLIPMEDRRQFALFLNRVHSSGPPAAGEITLVRADGTRARMFGWVARCVNERGEEEFQSVCVDVTERYLKKRESDAKRYMKALTGVYDKIFEYDFGAGTVKCIYSGGSAMFRWLENIPMQMEEATERWVEDTVDEKDRAAVRNFFHSFLTDRRYRASEKPPHIVYYARSSGGEQRLYSGVFLRTEEDVSLYCCRRVRESGEERALREENLSLKENIQELVLRFTDGIAAFEISDDRVKPLYASDNVCGFFGYSTEEWLPMMREGAPIREFLSRSEMSMGDLEELLRVGEGEFSYYDYSTGTDRKIRAICPKRAGGDLARYVMLYSVEEDGKSGSSSSSPDIRVRTFGYFDVFVDDQPIAFRNKKSKELFALLVDRRGGYITSEEAISFLWEDEPADSVVLARYRKVALRLKNTLEEYGIADVLESVNGNRRIVPERVRCDLYEYLADKEKNGELFKGSYLTNYSWGENTLAELTGDLLY